MNNVVPHNEAADLTRLMEHAVSQGESGVAALERLVALQERAQAIAAEREYNEALAAFQEATPPIARTRGIPDKQGNIKFRYAPLESIVASVGPALRANGLSYSFDTEASQGGVTVICTVTHTGGHSRQSHAFMPTPDIPQTSSAQKAGGAITFAKRTAFTNALGILTADDDRGGEETREGAGAREPVTAEQAATLAALCEEVGVDPVQLCRWQRVGTLEEFPAAHYAAAVARLESKR